MPICMQILERWTGTRFAKWSCCFHGVAERSLVTGEEDGCAVEYCCGHSHPPMPVEADRRLAD